VALKCEAGPLYCGALAEQVCLICGRYFCARHGDLAAPHCRRCTAAFARRRQEAAAAAAEVDRRVLAEHLNGLGQCGWPECPGPLLARCAHCGLQYCSHHSNRYRYTYRYRTRRGVEARQASVTLCDACKPALKAYKREKSWLEVG